MLLNNAIHMIGRASASCLAMIGGSTSSGNRPRTREILSRTSWAATSTSRRSSNSIVMALTSSRLVEARVRIPSIVFSSSSRTSVTSVSTTSGLAPGYTVTTDTTGGSTSGNSRTGRREYPITPNTINASVSIVAITGRRIQVSDQIIGNNQEDGELP